MAATLLLLVHLPQQIFKVLRDTDYLAQQADLAVFVADGTLATTAVEVLVAAVAGVLALHQVVVESSRRLHVVAVQPAI